MPSNREELLKSARRIREDAEQYLLDAEHSNRRHPGVVSQSEMDQMRQVVSQLKAFEKLAAVSR